MNPMPPASVWLTKAIGLCAGIFIGLTAWEWTEQEWFPVTRDLKISSLKIVDDDVILTGTVRKVRNCEYLAPVRARTLDGVPLQVVSGRKTATQTWSPSDTPQEFGPWTIFDGAGKEIEIYHVHRCNPLWLTYSQLGIIKP